MQNPRGNPPIFSNRVLGVLVLETGNSKLPMTMTDPRVFSHPVAYQVVRNATPHSVLKSDEHLAACFLEAATALENTGVFAITSNCGYACFYEETVKRAVSRPVLLSSLSLASSILSKLRLRARLGVLLFDSRFLSNRHLDAAGVQNYRDRLIFHGLENHDCWRNVLYDDEPQFELLSRAILEASHKMICENPSIAALLLECSLFLPFRNELMHKLHIPVFDYLHLSDLLMSDACKFDPSVCGIS